jgi:hypothetical protein
MPIGEFLGLLISVFVVNFIVGAVILNLYAFIRKMI